MPVSDLFKKSPKKESAKDNPLGSPELQQKRYDAAMEFLQHFQEKVPLAGGRPHAGTVLSVAARLAGTSLYRSLNYKVNPAPGVVVLSDEVNEAYPRLLHVFAFYCKQNGFDVMSKPLATEFPEKDKPRLELEEVRAEYQDQYDAIMKKYGLDSLDGAYAGMILCSIVFQYHCAKAKDIDPFVATGIIASGVIEGAKTAPPPSGSASIAGSTTEKQMKNISRLVLGERDAVIQEALDNGGEFIEPNPGVLDALKAAHIDPFMVYEKALLLQIEKRVRNIDFVQTDVDRLYAEWKGKPQAEAPMHVRLLLWMKENAASHGYEQRANSWVLKP